MKRTSILIAAFVVLGIISIVISTYSNSGESVNVDAKYVMEQCSVDSNTFPSSQILVEFIDYQTPFQNGVQGNEIHHSFRFENISGEPMNMNFTIFYETELDKYIIARDGIYLAENRSLTLKSGEGYHSKSIMSLLYGIDKYNEFDKSRVNKLSSKLYVEMILDEQKHYFILDFNDKTVLTN